MRILHLVAGSVIWLAMTGGVLADVLDGLAKRHRIVREPEYTSSAPKYGLLALGPQATTTIWLVHDGDALYVDRNANGDLTEAGEKVLAVGNHTDPEAGVYQFEVGDIRDGALLHKNLTIGVVRLDHLADRDQQIKQLLANDPKTRFYALQMDVDVPNRAGTGIGGRLPQVALSDVEGYLIFAERAEEAPVVHFGGAWQITLAGRHRLTVGRQTDLILAVGTPGIGAGTTAFVAYAGLIPDDAFPTVEIRYPAKSENDPPVQQHYELRQRC